MKKVDKIYVIASKREKIKNSIAFYEYPIGFSFLLTFLYAKIEYNYD